MKSKIVAVAVLALAASVFATTAPTFAQSDRVCLQSNRIWSWRVINERTLLVTDATAAEANQERSIVAIGDKQRAQLSTVPGSPRRRLRRPDQCEPAACIPHL